MACRHRFSKLKRLPAIPFRHTKPLYSLRLVEAANITIGLQYVTLYAEALEKSSAPWHCRHIAYRARELMGLILLFSHHSTSQLPHRSPCIIIPRIATR